VPTISELEDMANIGDKYAMFFLCRRLRKSQPDSARAWCIRAAEIGHLGALWKLSSDRNLTSEDRAHWLIILAGREDDDRRVDAARYRLAQVFETGDGLPANVAAERLLLLQTCNRRYHAGGAMRLARIYTEGIGGKIDRPHGLMWALLGSSSDVRQPPHWHCIMPRKALAECASFIEQIRESMTNESITIAEIRSKQYFDDKPFPNWRHQREKTSEEDTL
jgi:hypothetical protein